MFRLEFSCLGYNKPGTWPPKTLPKAVPLGFSAARHRLGDAADEGFLFWPAEPSVCIVQSLDGACGGLDFLARIRGRLGLSGMGGAGGSHNVTMPLLRIPATRGRHTQWSRRLGGDCCKSTLLAVPPS